MLLRMAKLKGQPRCIVIAGPNGAGKTTFARRYLPDEARVVNFVNADLIAGGLSPLKPELAAVAAARLLLREIERLTGERKDFALETTCSGLTARIQSWKQAGYRIDMVYLRLCSARLASRRIATRVRQGGHDVPRADVLRRFHRSGENFRHIYRPLADGWVVYDTSERAPRLLEQGSVKAKARPTPGRPPAFAAGVGRALRRAAKDAHKTARMHSTPLYVWANGKILKPL
jgi:predicted ABC-type ATPase